MPNDDLGQFPMPPKDTPAMPSDTPTTASSTKEDFPTPSTPSTPIPVPEAPVITPPQETPTSPIEPVVSAPSHFEETPDDIPSVQNTPPADSPATSTSEVAPLSTSPEPTVVSQPVAAPQNTPAIPPAPQESKPAPIPATLPPKSGPSFGPIIFAVLFFAAVGGLAGAAFLFQQTIQLRTQLGEITNTIKGGKTNITPTPTPTSFEVPQLSITPTKSATSSATITPTVTATTTPTPTVTSTPTPTVFNNGSPLKPLSIATKVLQIAINHSPNAQFILLKSENANDPDKASSKYFFRQDLTTKKYFYVLITPGQEPELVDKQIYVTPDDNIPSLNDLVLQDKLGIDLDEANQITLNNCTNQDTCKNASVKAQYISKKDIGVLWQLTLTTTSSTTPWIIQINADTKEVYYKSPEFSNP